MSSPGRSVSGAEVGAAVDVELRAGPARAGGAGLPEVVVAPEQHDPIVGNADRTPAGDRLAVGTEPELLVAAEDGDPDLVEVEPEAVGAEVEGELDGALLEVVADREVAQHLEEGQVPVGHADVLDVGRAKGLLAGGQPLRRRLLLTSEVGLEGLHSRGREQHRRVIGGGNERGRGHAQVPALLEERQELLPDLGGLHDGWSLGADPGDRCRCTARQ